MANVYVFNCFATCVQRRDRQSDSAAGDFREKGLLIQVSEVVGSNLVKWDQHLTEYAVKHFSGV